MGADAGHHHRAAAAEAGGEAGGGHRAAPGRGLPPPVPEGESSEGLEWVGDAPQGLQGGWGEWVTLLRVLRGAELDG